MNGYSEPQVLLGVTRPAPVYRLCLQVPSHARITSMKVPLSQLAHTRSGDKGDTCNIGVIALDEKNYPVLVREVTAERVKRHFGDRVLGEVERFELPNLGALNFLLHGALGGGGTVSLRTDAQGKTFGAG